MCLLLGSSVRRFYHSNPNQFNFPYRGIRGIPGVDMQHNTDGDTPSNTTYTGTVRQSVFRREKLFKSALHHICMNRKFKEKMRNNFSPGLRAALNRLKNNRNLIIIKSDKGNCTVVIDREQYIKEGMRQLSSCAHYMPIDKDLT